MAYSTDKDNPVLVLQACHRPYTICFFPDEIRATLHERRRWIFQRPASVRWWKRRLERGSQRLGLPA